MRKFLNSITAGMLLMAACAISLSAADFPADAGSLGAIPDYPVNAGGCHVSGWVDKNITFNVSGISGAPTNVEIKNLTFSPAHTWGGDISATLIAPGGTSSIVFGRIGAVTATAAGTSSDLAGPYGFRNTADPNIWGVSATTPLPSNTYAAVVSGGAGVTNPAPTVNLDAAFAGVASPNGTWTLRMRDGCDGDTGSVSAVTLTVDGAAAPAANGPHDINGDGTSDWTVVRSDGPAFAELNGANDLGGRDKVANQITRGNRGPSPEVGIGWWTRNNDGSNGTRTGHGQDTDFFMIADVAGDSRDELIVWSPGAAGVAAFKYLNASTSTVTTRVFGQSGDDPTVLNDMNADGKFDLVVYRDGTAGSPQSFFFWANESTPTSVNFIPWGTDGDVAYTLDYDGDGRGDAAIQRNGGGGVGHHWIRQSSNGATVFVNYGLSSDFVVPGDYDGDGRDDICVSRNANFGTGTFKYFWIRESDGGGTPESPVQWGIPGDFITQGDYDGDGRTDVAVWRSNADPNLNFFYARRSSTGALQAQEWGQSGDYPVNNWDVH